MADVIKLGATWPYLEIRFIDAKNEPVDCRAFSIVMQVKNRRGEIVIDTLLGEGAAVWTDQEHGAAQYQWLTGDTDERGNFTYEFIVTRLSDGKVFKLPKDSFLNYTVE